MNRCMIPKTHPLNKLRSNLSSHIPSTKLRRKLRSPSCPSLTMFAGARSASHRLCPSVRCI